MFSVGLLVCLSRYSWALGDSYLSEMRGLNYATQNWIRFQGACARAHH